MIDKHPKSFTIRANGARLREIVSDVGVLPPLLDPNRDIQPSDSDIHWFKALWDTGATGTCVSSSVVTMSGLVATGGR